MASVQEEIERFVVLQSQKQIEVSRKRLLDGPDPAINSASKQARTGVHTAEDTGITAINLTEDWHIHCLVRAQDDSAVIEIRSFRQVCCTFHVAALHSNTHSLPSPPLSLHRGTST